MASGMVLFKPQMIQLRPNGLFSSLLRSALLHSGLSVYKMVANSSQVEGLVGSNTEGEGKALLGKDSLHLMVFD